MSAVLVQIANANVSNLTEQVWS